MHNDVRDMLIHQLHYIVLAVVKQSGLNGQPFYNQKILIQISGYPKFRVWLNI